MRTYPSAVLDGAAAKILVTNLAILKTIQFGEIVQASMPNVNPQVVRRLTGLLPYVSLKGAKRTLPMEYPMRYVDIGRTLQP